jgi:hypothetical protein
LRRVADHAASEFIEPFAQLGQGQNARRLAVEFADDGRWRFDWRHQAEPYGYVESGKAGLIHRRDIGGDGKALQ